MTTKLCCMPMIQYFMCPESFFNTLSDRLTIALEKFGTWTTKNKLTINENKTKIMTFASEKKLKTLPKQKSS